MQGWIILLKLRRQQVEIGICKMAKEFSLKTPGTDVLRRHLYEQHPDSDATDYIFLLPRKGFNEQSLNIVTVKVNRSAMDPQIRKSVDLSPEKRSSMLLLSL
jgi:hypothetical protein